MARNLLCSVCGTTKAATEFTEDEAKKDDTTRTCIDCEREAAEQAETEAARADSALQEDQEKRLFACEDGKWRTC